jgi:hypothetical protein
MNHDIESLDVGRSPIGGRCWFAASNKLLEQRNAAAGPRCIGTVVHVVNEDGELTTSSVEGRRAEGMLNDLEEKRVVEIAVEVPAWVSHCLLFVCFY